MPLHTQMFYFSNEGVVTQDFVVYVETEHSKTYIQNTCAGIVGVPSPYYKVSELYRAPGSDTALPPSFSQRS